MILHMGGGGAKELAIKVVGGTVQPTGEAGLIWVNTPTTINKWTMAVAQPTSPAIGDIWIQMDAVSSNLINLIKRNNVANINVLSIKQYDGSAWTAHSAYYHNGTAWGQVSHSAIVDAFNRANSTILGNADTGEPWTTVLGAYGFGINSNAAYGITVSQDAYSVVEYGANNAEISVTLSTYSDYIGLLFRYADANNYWTVQSAGSGILYCSGKSSGAAFGGAIAGWQATGLTIANGSALKVRANGTSIKVYLNGTLVIDITSSNAPSGTKHGIKAYSNAARLDNISVNSL